MLACGPYFETSGLVASLVIFILIKPIAYFAFIQAYRYRVSRAIPMPFSKAAKLAALRAVLGVVLVGGGTWVLAGIDNHLIASWIYLYVARLAAWWWVGKFGAGVRGARLVGWTLGGTILNVAFDVAAVAGLMEGWVYPTIGVAVISAFIMILHRVGRRDRLRNRFSSDPFCDACNYNLTGNLSGICPECGTPIPHGPTSTASETPSFSP